MPYLRRCARNSMSNGERPPAPGPAPRSEGSCESGSTTGQETRGPIQTRLAVVLNVGATTDQRSE